MNVFVFFLIMPKFAPFTCCYEHSTFFCCFFSLIQLMYFLSPPFFYIFPPLFGLSWPTFTSFLRLLSISPLTHPVSLDHAFHYSAASIDLLSGWSAIDHNACSSATELRRCCCARKSYIQTRGWSLKTHCALRLLLLFFFFDSISYHFKPLATHCLCSLASPHAHWVCISAFIGKLIGSALPKDMSSCAIPQPSFWNWLPWRRVSWRDLTSGENRNLYRYFFLGKECLRINLEDV